MPYLLSLLGTAAASTDSKQRLCCYSNNTATMQLIRAVKEAACLFEHVVFAGERVLFAALPGSALEIRSLFSETASLSRVDCNHLCLQAAPEATQAAMSAKGALQTGTQSQTAPDANLYVQ